MVELSFNVEKQNIQVFEDAVSEDRARQLAEENKHKSFGLISTIIRKFDKSNEDIVLTHIEKRYDPFWHIVGELYLEYKRMTEYTVSVKPEVQAVRIDTAISEVMPNTKHAAFMAEDHCLETSEKEIVVDAVTGKPDGLKSYLGSKARVIRQTEDLMGENKVVVPVKIKASYLVRDMIKDLIKPFHADKIIRETVEVKRLTLYFKPAYAFEFKEKSTGKTRVLEVDALTGKVQAGSVFKRELAEVFSENEIFQVGKDVTLALLPGGQAAEVLVKKLVQKRKEKKDEEIKSRIHRAEKRETEEREETRKDSASSRPSAAGRTRISLGRK